MQRRRRNVAVVVIDKRTQYFSYQGRSAALCILEAAIPSPEAAAIHKHAVFPSGAVLLHFKDISLKIKASETGLRVKGKKCGVLWDTKIHIYLSAVKIETVLEAEKKHFGKDPISHTKVDWKK